MIDEIKEAIRSILSADCSLKKIKIPFNKTYLINKVYSQFEIKSNIQKEDCTELEVLISELEYQKIMKALKE